MSAIAQLHLIVQGKDEASKVLKDIDTAGSGLKKTLGGIAQVAGGILAAQGLNNLGGMFTSATSAASDLEQSIGGMQSVFGESADQLLEWGKTADQSVGLSRNAFNELAAPLGAMLKSAGFGMEEVSSTTLDLTTKAADLAATFGGPVEDAMQAIGSLMRGETNPIERYGVAIKQSDVNMKALAMTGKQSEKDLTPLELQQARLALLFEQTADSQGQFAREADTAAGKAERLRAAQENAAAQLGEHLLPIQLKITEAKAKFVELLATKVIPAVGRFAETVLPPMAAAIALVTENSDILYPALGAVAAGLTVALIPAAVAATTAIYAKAVAWGVAAAAMIAANLPLIALVAVIAGLTAGVILLVKHWDDVTARFPILQRVADEVKAGLQAFVDWIQDPFIPTVLAIATAVGDAVDGAVGFVTDNWPAIKDLFEEPLEATWLVFEAIFNQIQIHIETVIGIIKGVVDVFMGVFTGDWDRAWSGVKQIVGSAWEGIVDTIENAIGLVKNLAPLALEAATGIGGAMKDGIIAGIKGTVGVIGDLTSQVWGAIKTLINSGIQAINDLIPNQIELKVLGVGKTIDLPDNPIPMLATGARNFAGGLAIVGERGPELVSLPPGSNVYSNRESRSMVGGGGNTYVVNVTVEGDGDEQKIQRVVLRSLESQFGPEALAYGWRS